MRPVDPDQPARYKVHLELKNESEYREYFTAPPSLVSRVRSLIHRSWQEGVDGYVAFGDRSFRISEIVTFEIKKSGLFG